MSLILILNKRKYGEKGEGKFYLELIIVIVVNLVYLE